MVILNIYGKIEPICISEKLKVYISNLPCQSDNNWNEGLVEDMLQEIKERSIFSDRYESGFASYNLHRICCETLNLTNISDALTDMEYLQQIADNLVCIYFDYDYDDMPFFDWTTNCFDSRLCEEDYAEKLIKFLNYIVWKNEQFVLDEYSCFPSCIYSSNHDRQYSFLLGALDTKYQDAQVYIRSLQHWGKIIDNFLIDENDYLQLDYLINAVYKDNEYNAYHVFKVFSLCEMLLTKKSSNGKPSDLDNKLPHFVLKGYLDEGKTEFAKTVRLIRNKIGHGDFLHVNKLLEEYAKRFMDGHYNYDYTEYSRMNWIYLHLCCELDDILARILFILFTDRNELEKIKQS